MTSSDEFSADPEAMARTGFLLSRASHTADEIAADVRPTTNQLIATAQGGDSEFDRMVIGKIVPAVEASVEFVTGIGELLSGHSTQTADLAVILGQVSSNTAAVADSNAQGRTH